MINENNYKAELNGVCVVEISGESCANCLTLMPILRRICDSRSIKLVHIEATNETVKLMEILDVRTAPTILIVKDGIVYASARGYQPEEILEIWIDAKIAELV